MAPWPQHSRAEVPHSPYSCVRAAGQSWPDTLPPAPLPVEASHLVTARLQGHAHSCVFPQPLNTLTCASPPHTQSDTPSHPLGHPYSTRPTHPHPGPAHTLAHLCILTATHLELHALCPHTWIPRHRTPSHPPTYTRIWAQTLRLPYTLLPTRLHSCVQGTHIFKSTLPHSHVSTPVPPGPLSHTPTHWARPAPAYLTPAHLGSLLPASVTH